MRFDVPCTDRNTGRPYSVAMDARSAAQAQYLVSLAGHAVNEDPPAPPAPSPTVSAVPRAAVMPHAPTRPAADGFSVTAIVLGAFAIPGSLLPFVGFTLAIAGLIFACFGKRGSAARIAGFTICVCAILFSIMFTILGLLLVRP